MNARLKRKRNALPLPPFGAAVLDAVMNKRTLNTFITAGPDAWNRFAHRVDRVVLPPKASPDDFDWSIFRGQEPTVIGDDGDMRRLRRLCWLLLRAGARLVCLVYEDSGITRAAFIRNE